MLGRESRSFGTVRGMGFIEDGAHMGGHGGQAPVQIQRNLLVAQLAALALTGHGCPRGLMAQADGRLAAIDVLPAGAGASGKDELELVLGYAYSISNIQHGRRSNLIEFAI